MIITLDNSTLTLLINPSARPPNDPSTGGPVTYAKERIEALIAGLVGSDRLIIPAPVLAELLVGAGEGGPEIINQIQSSARLQVVPFDQRAAVELAVMTREAETAGSKKGVSLEPWQKVKFDRQIIAIAKVVSSDAILSDDKKLCEFAQSVGVPAQSTWDLPVPSTDPGLFDNLQDGD
jgi:hypothetical protein